MNLSPGSLEDSAQRMQLQKEMMPAPQEEGEDKPPAKKKPATKDQMLSDRTVLGFAVVIEHERGDERYGRTLPADYGYIRQTDSAERGDQMDCFVGPDGNATHIFIINSYDMNGRFDETKVMLRYADEDSARADFRAITMTGASSA